MTGHAITVKYAAMALAPERGAWVNLTRLRNALPYLTRTEIDAALREIDRQREADLIPEANQKTLSETDRANAIRIGGEDKHLISVL